MVPLHSNFDFVQCIYFVTISLRTCGGRCLYSELSGLRFPPSIPSPCMRRDANKFNVYACSVSSLSAINKSASGIIGCEARKYVLSEYSYFFAYYHLDVLAFFLFFFFGSCTNVKAVHVNLRFLADSLRE